MIAGHVTAMRAYTFRPKLWAVLLTAGLAGGMTTAGFWQYGRGVQKQHLQADRATTSALSAVPLLEDITTPPPGEVRKVLVEGRYLPELTVQLDNQPRQRQPGAHVWTPLELADGRRVIVNRGWIPLGAAASPPPEGLQQLQGGWRSLPRAGMLLGAAPAACASPRPQSVNYPQLAEVRCLFGSNTLNGVLELDAAAPGGFARDWAVAGSNEVPPSRHFGYAAQWWLFAITLVALFTKIHLKRRPAQP